MIKQITQFQVKIQEIENTFNFAGNCPVEVAKAALFECLKWLGQIEDAAKAQTEALKEEKKEEEDGKPADEPNPEV